MTTLTSLELDPNDPVARYTLLSPQRIHAAVRGCFDGVIGEGKILWRLDRVKGKDGHHHMMVFLQGPGIPNHTISERLPSTRPARSVDMDSTLLAHLEADQTYRFNMVVCPTYVSDGKKHTHVADRFVEQWLRDRQDRLGLEFGDVRIADGPQPSGFAHHQSNGTEGTVRFHAKRAYGTLRVTDPLLARAALCEGVGPKAAYGCGLLTLVGM